MKEYIKIVIILLLTAFLCGCVERNVTDVESDIRPDIFVKRCYKDYCNAFIGESSYLALPNFEDHSENYTYLPYRICENDNDFYYVINNSVYKYSDNNSKLVYSPEKDIYALIYVYQDNLFYTTDDSIWKYNLRTLKSEKVIDANRKYFNTVVLGDNIVVEGNRFLFYDLEKEKITEIENAYDMDQENLNDLVPDGFYVIHKEKYNSIDQNILEVFYYSESGMEKAGFNSIVVIDNVEDDWFRLFDYRTHQKINIIDDCLYSFYVSGETDSYYQPPTIYGSAERCRTKYWKKDFITKIEGPDFSSRSNEEKKIYEDSENRILGYNPDTNEVYLYVFDNHTITSKNLDDQSEIIVETLDEADTIYFEWRDTRLYWIYDKNGTEEFGGCHEFY
ncbi:MAG: hypothetical protein J5625_06785 [Lachnospiraceae bacterium]|nr:hypothetical protein [Lachnospiraceae bacterium]